ncbi:MAG: hypothetical protein IPM23_17465 [Candidatus Melainabacteria bacterium]|nr:hypothetical protein [Candidatus Melainabacteria bacterium]
MSIRKAALVSMAILIATGISTGLPVIQQALAAFKPSDVYRQYLNHVYYAKSVHQIENYFMEPTRKNLENLRGELAEAALKRYKRSYIANFKVIKEEVVGDMAFIEAEGLASDWGQVCHAKARVEMIRESGAWKIKHQVWQGLVNTPRGQNTSIK